ncbi:hypothetical protein O6H91_16G027700 [Diphasiastrum complanatum]|uniref:Uncharacterized protein n=1 Tax=Diphasiastrum complanatum TaxID=34168 RepID=A0ACC2BBX2_DIPCM|nr:hypothetical protein O6H91_16G027700 [Diphasiastrum complanatum]
MAVLITRSIIYLLVLSLVLEVIVLSDGSQFVYKDPSQPVEARVKDLLGRMTLKEKIGQMTQIERSIASFSVINQYGIAKQASPSVWYDMVDGFQQGALSTRLGIPMIYGIDAVHGHNNVYGATLFPHNIGLGATRDPFLARRIGVATALEVRGTGIPYVFAPCIATCRDPRWGRCYESYGEDTDLVRNMTDIIIGLQGEPTVPGTPFVGGGSRVAACAKHFVGDGGTVDGIDENNTVTSYQELVKIHMAPYVDAIAKGVSTVMISYSSFNGVKMHRNKFLITKVLKRQLGFKGFTISDFLGIDRITTPPDANYTYSVLVSVNAGIDMIMVPFDYPTFINTLEALVLDGSISMRRINSAVRRILRVKFTLGLFEQPMATRSLNSEVGQDDHRKLAREAVRKSVVLLKNGKMGDAPLLPLDKTAPKILVAGTHANDIGLQCGGWSISWQGSAGNTTIGTTILEGISTVVGGSTEVDHQVAPDANYPKGKGYSYGIVVIGEPPYAEIPGDSSNLTIPSDGIQTIQNVCSSLKCLVILISGRPLVIEPYLPMMDAFVAAWLPGTEGAGIADVIFGDYDFNGKLPRTWFKTVDQLPMNVGDKNYDPLFPYGFGLSMNLHHRTSNCYLHKAGRRITIYIIFWYTITIVGIPLLAAGSGHTTRGSLLIR